jgi:hypothetical protein
VASHPSIPAPLLRLIFQDDRLYRIAVSDMTTQAQWRLDILESNDLLCTAFFPTPLISGSTILATVLQRPLLHLRTQSPMQSLQSPPLRPVCLRRTTLNPDQASRPARPPTTRAFSPATLQRPKRSDLDILSQRLTARPSFSQKVKPTPRHGVQRPHLTSRPRRQPLSLHLRQF